MPPPLIRFTAGCIACDTRPCCPRCFRPIQEGDRGACPEPYGRGLLWAFATEAELAAWEAQHLPGHAGSWSLRM